MMDSNGLVGGGCGIWKMGIKGLIGKGLVVFPCDYENPQGERGNEIEMFWVGANRLMLMFGVMDG